MVEVGSWVGRVATAEIHRSDRTSLSNSWLCLLAISVNHSIPIVNIWTVSKHQQFQLGGIHFVHFTLIGRCV